MEVELVTDPFRPTVPDAVTLIAFEVKRTAGPYATRPVAAAALWGLLEASGATVAVGVGPVGGPKLML